MQYILVEKRFFITQNFLPIEKILDFKILKTCQIFFKKSAKKFPQILVYLQGLGLEVM